MHWRCNVFRPRPREMVEEIFQEDRLELTEDTTHQDFEPENHEWSGHYIDWATWKPPMFKAALLRRTASSCYENDWYNLEKTSVLIREASGARAFPVEYGKFPPTKAAYPPAVVRHLVSKFVALGYRLEKVIGKSDL